MINSIPFTSTYKVHTSSKDAELKKFNKFEDLCEEKEMTGKAQSKYEDRISSKYPHEWSGDLTLVAPMSMDNEIERYCAYYGIDYKKLMHHKLLAPEAINSRIEAPKENMNLVYIDSQKLEDLAEEQLGNFKHCRQDYEEYYKNNVDFHVKSGDKIPATTLYIGSIDANNDDLLEYVDYFGIDNLNTNQIFIDFNKETDEADHCVYFALKNLGMDKIPVYVNDETLEIGDKLGLFE